LAVSLDICMTPTTSRSELEQGLELLGASKVKSTLMEMSVEDDELELACPVSCM
jgi:hypothetical protein